MLGVSTRERDGSRSRRAWTTVVVIPRNRRHTVSSRAGASNSPRRRHPKLGEFTGWGGGRRMEFSYFHFLSFAERWIILYFRTLLFRKSLSYEMCVIYRNQKKKKTVRVNFFSRKKSVEELYIYIYISLNPTRLNGPRKYYYLYGIRRKNSKSI